MVKLGSQLSDKLEKQPSLDDGFDNIPLITPLEVTQLQQPFPDKVIVKTTTEYQQQKKKKMSYVPGINKLNIHLYDEMSEKMKLTGLILLTLGFLACFFLVIMYNVLWFNQLTCPEGFVLKHKHCTPAALEMYYIEQQEPVVHSSAPPTRGLYAALGHFTQVKRTSPDLPLPWLPVISALKEAERAKEAVGPLKE
ncbi:LOW QUALITY PROTEIN: calcyon neuron-specific vesicular protein [Osmerus mordax]|uniref:LOW QUALITY PROTEIN: calcyon neuron-specific vesicular protein n=1 Tax=Osmerus mordax TaxID=8014 RepID=UPI00350F551E